MCGFVRAGWIGLRVAGASFILPAALITGAFAWAYMQFGARAQAVSVLAGIKAAVLAVIGVAIWRLGKTAVKNVCLAVLGVISLAASFLGAHPIAILFGGGLAGMLGRRLVSIRGPGTLFFSPSSGVFSGSAKSTLRATFLRSFGVVAVASGAATGVARPPTVSIALFFLKIGAVLYGGGYVLLAFLEQGLVRQHSWLTQQQLLDAVAIGQFTPGPALSTATFIGYILGGVPGAAVATVAIFLPSFFYVALLAPVLFRLRQSAWLAAFLDSVNVCAVALMAGVTFRLAADALRGWQAWAIAVIALAGLLRWKVSPAWVVLGGGVVRLLLAAHR
jgi:chromate transporter